MKIVIITILTCVIACAQSFDLSKIEAESVRKMLSQLDSPSQLEASCLSPQIINDNIQRPKCKKVKYKSKRFDDKDYGHHEKIYTLNASKRDIFLALTRNDPRKVWSGLSDFQVKYNKNKQSIEYKSDKDISNIEVGDFVFLNLKIRLIKKIVEKEIPVGFQVITLDEENGVIAFSYLMQNESKGIQYLIINEEDGMSKIKHISRFLSGKSFRDKFLYARFHEKLVDDFYMNLKKTINPLESK